MRHEGIIQGYRVVVPIKPVAWQRAGRNGRVYYTKAKTAAAEEAIRIAAKAQGVHERLPGPLHVIVRAFVPRPKDHTRAQKLIPWVSVKPDWDNYGKLVSDALNGVAWVDDGQVACCTVEKLYADTGAARWVIEVRRIAGVAEVAA
jgi:Holliday junction resolvase RusA-like endonuclease